MKKLTLYFSAPLLLFTNIGIADPLTPEDAQQDSQHDAQVQCQTQVLDDLDMRIDQEEQKGYLQPWQANQLRNEVQTLRYQEDNYIEQDAFDAKAAAISQQLDSNID